MSQRIVIVEDDDDQRNNYKDAIEKKGYEVVAYDSKESALIGFEGALPDLVVLDIILKEETDAGFELCRALMAKDPTLPIIFLTERIDEIDKISGLRMGAWDYLSKPISLNYLTVRISSLLHINQSHAESGDGAHAGMASEDDILVGELAVNSEAMRVTWKGQRVNLSATELRMLANLIEKPEYAVSYESFMNAAMESLVTRNTINTHMHNIRKKIRRVDPSFTCIKSEYGYGYRWTSES